MKCLATLFWDLASMIVSFGAFVVAVVAMMAGIVGAKYWWVNWRRYSRHPLAARLRRRGAILRERARQAARPIGAIA